ncbi:serine hydrolase [Chryseolinea sp. T2]|uniref:serine hydrolase n=1 Tax=Chryseolinea sp. T2 TaxID=3129255 RepID=UPI0030779635
MRIAALCAALMISVVAAAQKPVSQKTINEFDSYVSKAMKEWDVPGLSIVVVKDGKILLKKGYGVRELGRQGAVDTQTLFSCASTTKAMTALVLGTLVDEGKLNWDDPVNKYIPELRLRDPYVTRELRVRDLLLHNTGVAGTDYFWDIADFTWEEMIQKLVHVEPSYSFRAGFEYQNTMYMIAGVVIERITGKKWNDVMTERLFKPLGMTSTVPDRVLTNSPNITKPHFAINGEIKIIGYDKSTRIGAAGGVWSNVDDMSKWILALLDSGKYEGGRLVKAASFRELFKPQTIAPHNDYPTFSILKPHWVTYGLGWYQIDYRGRMVNFHTGSLAGLTAIAGLLQDDRFGVYIFGNYDHAEVRHALMYKAFDHFVLGNDRDWNAEFKTLYTSLKQEHEKRVREFENDRVASTKTTLPLAEFEGEYVNEVYGITKVTVVGNSLRFDVNNGFLVAELPHWHYDTFYGAAGDHYKLSATFIVGVNGKVEKLNFDGLEFGKSQVTAKPSP